MKSYFSQLAKQSGLRYGRANVNSLAPMAKKEVGEFAPLHREETILAAHVLPKVDAPQKKKSKSLSPEKFSPEKPPQKSEVKPAENNIAYFSKDLKASPLPTAQNFDTPNRTVHSAAQIQNQILKENQSNEQTARVPAELPVVEQPVFTENKITSEKNRSDFPPTQIDFQSEISAQSEIETVPRQLEYFKKTAGSLETGTMDKLEIQQILLQEIYEWVNDAPALTDDRNETKKTNLKQIGEVRAIVAPLEERLLAEQHDAANIIAEDPKPLEEQNFNLSIGTITIVVEEPPPIQNMTIQKTSTEKPKTINREFSRLSRYYL